MARLVPAVLASLCFGLVAALPANAADSNAPHGARGDWLPMDEWVMSGWMPYDEQRLDLVLHTDRAELSVWLNDKRTLGALARRRGFTNMRALALKLVQTRDVSTTQRHVLLLRALDTLTQAHLARHLLFHLYHTSALRIQAKRVFGVSPAGYVRLRDSGDSPIQIGNAGGVHAVDLRKALVAFFHRRAQRSIALQASSPRQAKYRLAEQIAGLDTFMRTHYRTTSEQKQFAGNPHHYGSGGDSVGSSTGSPKG